MSKYDPQRILGICVVVSAMIDAVRNEIYSKHFPSWNPGRALFISAEIRLQPIWAGLHAPEK